MKQTRVKAGHIELVQGSKYTKHVKLMLLINYVHKTKDDQIYRSAFFFSSGGFVFWLSSIKHTFVFIAYFQAKKINYSKPSVAHKLKRDCFIYLGIEIL